MIEYDERRKYWIIGELYIMANSSEEQKRERRRRVTGKAKFRLLVIAAFLVLIGEIFIYEFSSNPNYFPYHEYYADKQAFCMIAALICAILVSKIDYHRWYTIGKALLAISILAVIICGIGEKISAVHWIYGHFLRIGDFYINLSNVLLFSFCIVLAEIICKKGESWGWVAGYYFLATMLFASQYDTNSLLIYTIIFFIVFFFRNPKSTLSLGFFTALLFGICTYASYISRMYSERILVWLDPFRDRYGLGYSTVQSLYTIAIGGPFGIGIGEPKIGYYMPEAITTYMMSGIIAEIGLIGAALILLVYCIFLTEAAKIAMRAADRYGFYLAAVIIVKFIVFLVLDLFVITNIVPATRIKIPFLSYQDSDIIFDFILIGILLNISRQSIALSGNQEA